MPPRPYNPICSVSVLQWHRGCPLAPRDSIAQPPSLCLRPLPALPRSQRLRCGQTPQPVPNPELALGEASLARGAPTHPISPLGFGVGTDHMKDTRPQARADAKPQEPGAGAEASRSHPTSRAAGHRLCLTQGPQQQGALGPRSLLHAPQHPHRGRSGDPACREVRAGPGAAALQQGPCSGRRGQQAETELRDGAAEPSLPGDTRSPHVHLRQGQDERGIRTYSCSRGGFQRCLVGLGAS